MKSKINLKSLGLITLYCYYRYFFADVMTANVFLYAGDATRSGTALTEEMNLIANLIRSKIAQPMNSYAPITVAFW